MAEKLDRLIESSPFHNASRILSQVLVLILLVSIFSPVTSSQAVASNQFDLTVTPSSFGSVSVSGGSAVSGGISNCSSSGGTCSATYTFTAPGVAAGAQSNTVILIATPNSGYTFSSWSTTNSAFNSCGKSSTCPFRFSAGGLTGTVVANFTNSVSCTKSGTYVSAGYTYEVFTNPGTSSPDCVSSWSPPISSPNTLAGVEVLLVGGGGGGGGNTYSGGGGAGAATYLVMPSAITAQDYFVSIGSGGNAGGGLNCLAASGSNGGASYFHYTSDYSYVAPGGGGGGGTGTNSNDSCKFDGTYSFGFAGGSGGASGDSNLVLTVAGATSTVRSQTSSISTFYGNDGGPASSNLQATSGGGGAGGAGSLARSRVGGAGGVGTNVFSTWLTITGMGVLVSGSRYIAGGGGGYSRNGVSNGIGGSGGGGSGGGGSATASTGGGGGQGGSGASGLVIIRYPTPATPAAPTYTSLTPSSGTTAGGTSVTITGTNLSSATSVTVGGSTATINSNTATAITITTPSGSAGAKNVVITTAGGSVTAGSAFTYTVPAPTYTSLTPTSGTTAGGTSVTITGTNLSSATSVTVGGSTATISSNTATAITITTPSGSAGTKNVVITTAGGSVTAGSAFTYVVPAPTYTLLSPTSGTTAGGTSVTIVGTNLSSATSVTVGGGTAIINSNSATAITITTPSGSAGAKDVVITTAGGSVTAGSAFTYLSPGLTPIFDTPTRTSGGFSVSITNFDATYTWTNLTVSAGSVAVTSTEGTTRVITVTGLTSGQSATVTQVTSKTGFTNASANVSGTALTTQSITWSPTTSLLTTDSPATPSTLASSLGSVSISYSLVNAGTTGCTIDSSTAAITFNAPGSCVVRASTNATATYTAGNTDVTFVISQATRLITVTQTSNGSISPTTTTLNYGADQLFTFTPNTGYSVATITVDGSLLSSAALEAAIATGYSFTNVTSARSITATYSANSYSITYKAGTNGSGSDLTQNFTFGSNPTLKDATAALARTGYAIAGW